MLVDRRCAFLFALLPLFLTQCTGLYFGFLPPSTVSPGESLQIARSYLNHRWMPSVANVKHGPDRLGVQVDTPDIGYHPEGAVPGWWTPGAEATGIPYQWGGFVTLTQFDAGVEAGKAAGDVYTEAKRAALDDAVSSEAVGIDCSGFISRCWKLPRSFSTRELPKLCVEIGWEELQPGDILNTHNAHAILIEGWQGRGRDKLMVYETGRPPTWKVLHHALSVPWLKAQGYQPYRYRGMKAEQVLKAVLP